MLRSGPPPRAEENAMATKVVQLTDDELRAIIDEVVAQTTIDLEG